MPMGRAMHTILWGLFCACSWTWCIGMYLPKIMVERWGWPGFIVFAAPNVLGCAAMGYVVRTPERSRAMVERHGKWMVAFSAVTVAYHMFFLTWFPTQVPDTETFPNPRDQALAFWLTAAVVACLYVLVVILKDRDRGWLLLTVLTYGLSLLILTLVGFDALSASAWTGRASQSDLWWTAPTIAFGFLLCPYLDLTFHRAVRNSPSRHSFGIFGITFFVMILLTCLMWFSASENARGLIVWQILAQSLFTCAVHLREIRESKVIRSTSARWIILMLPLLAALIVPLIDLVGDVIAEGDNPYLRFLVFYGLVFPTYAVVFMGPRAVDRNRRMLTAFAVIVLASLPLYELGFIHRMPWLLVIPLVVLIGWRISAISAKRIVSSAVEADEPITGGTPVPPNT